MREKGAAGSRDLQQFRVLGCGLGFRVCGLWFENCGLESKMEERLRRVHKRRVYGKRSKLMIT